MADQQTRVSLIFEANASQAKNEINGLVQSLQKIQSMPRSLIDPTGIKEASKAAMELQGHIQKAINVDTGKLDLSRFATSLKDPTAALSRYRDTLTRIGPEGSAAFRSVLTSINNAEVSTVRLTKGMRDFLTTMKNTAKWQISSSIMHGFIGGIQSAYNYAQQLDASLNSIRIVTGQTSDQMARFAVEANKAAQSLSTTTTKYTDAALIFYQQGLGDKAVKERTEAVIKMANVTGEAAADVSSYMTAIWNNFADGTKALEYYEDVITKLGASTAASSKEIAGGLEKFAAIGNTIGLSYEYATSMIATIVDKTRQSEDVVGTALKTILARIQGLNLGETLEDGTTLNKYSQALADVGVNIKDASGQLKDMDVILDDLGSKWSTFDRATQTALAQVVGGVRQYNQIISLMNNWDSFKGNVDLARTSEGTLDEQADIYAESWEAARRRVTAAAQGMYDALIDEKTFITINKFFENILNGATGAAKAMGGMIPILTTIGGLLATKYAKEMPVMMRNMMQNISVLSGVANKKALQTQQAATNEAALGISRADTDEEAVQYDSIRRVSLMREQLIKNQHKMNSEEIAQYEMLIKNEQAIGQINAQKAKSIDLARQELNLLKEKLALELSQKNKAEFEKDMSKGAGYAKAWDKIAAEKEQQRKDDEKYIKDYENKTRTELEDRNYQQALSRQDLYKNNRSQYYNQVDQEAQQLYMQTLSGNITKFTDNVTSLGTLEQKLKDVDLLLKNNSFAEYGNNMDGLKLKAQQIAKDLNDAGVETTEFEQAMKILDDSTVSPKAKIEALTQALGRLRSKTAMAYNGVEDEVNRARGVLSEDLSESQIKDLEANARRQGRLSSNLYTQADPAKIKTSVKATQALTGAVGALTTGYAAYNSILNATNILQDDSASTAQKAGAAISAATSTMMAMNSALSIVKMGWMGIIALMATAAIAYGVYAASKWQSDEEKRLEKLKKKAEGLKKSYDALNEQIKETGETFEQYDQAVAALEECAAGTQDWYNALVNVNSIANEILAKSPQLAKYARWDENGMLYWDEGANEYFQQQKDLSNMLNASQIIAQAESDYASAFKTDKTYGNKALEKIYEYEQENYKDFSNSSFDLANEEDYNQLVAYAEHALDAFGGIWDNLGIQTDEATKKAMSKTESLFSEIFGQNIATYLFNGEGVRSFAEVQSEVQGKDDAIAYTPTSVSSIFQTPEELYAAEVQMENAISSIFGGKDNYKSENNPIYAELYRKSIDKEIENIKSSKPTSASLEDMYEKATGLALTDQGNDTFKLEKSGEILSIDALYEAIAASNLNTDSGFLNQIISDSNTLLNKSTDFGRSLLLSGVLGSERSRVGYDFKRAETYEMPALAYDANIAGTQDTINALKLEADKINDYSEGYEGIDFESLANTEGIDLNQFRDSNSEAEKQLQQAIDDYDAAVVEKKNLEDQLSEVEQAQATIQSAIGSTLLDLDTAKLSRQVSIGRKDKLSTEQSNLEAEQEAILEQGKLSLEDIENSVANEQIILDGLVDKQEGFSDYLASETEFNTVLNNLNTAYDDRDSKMAEIATLKEQQYLDDDFFKTFFGEDEDLSVIQGATSEWASQMINKGYETLGELWRMEEGDLGYQFKDYTIKDLDRLANVTNYAESNTQTSDALNKAEEDLAIIENDISSYLDALYGPEGLIETEKQNLSKGIAESQTIIAEASQKIKDYESNESDIASIGTELQALETTIAVETEKINGYNQQMAALVALDEAYAAQILNLESKIEEIDLNKYNQDIIDAQTEADKQAVNKYYQGIWDNIIKDLDSLGIKVEEEFQTISEAFTFEQAFNKAKELLAQTGEKVSGALADAEAARETAYKSVLDEYFSDSGITTDEFIEQYAKGKTYEELTKAIAGADESEEGKKLKTMAEGEKGRKFLTDLGINTENLTNEEIAEQYNELSARQHLIESLVEGENLQKTYDFTTDEGWLKFLKDGYGNSIYGVGWEGLVDEETGDLSRVSGLEAQSKIVSANNKTKAMSVDTWNKYVKEDRYKGETQQNEDGYSELITESDVLNTLIGEKGIRASVQEVESMAKILGTASDRMNVDEYDSFMGYTDQLLKQSKNAGGIAKAMNDAMSYIQTTGKDLTTENIQEYFGDLGVNFDSLEGGAEGLAAALNGAASVANMAAGAIDNLTNSLSGIGSTLKDLKSGDSISAEDWEKIKNNIADDSLFYDNAEGGKTFVGTDEQAEQIFQQALNDAATTYAGVVEDVKGLTSDEYYSSARMQQLYMGDKATMESSEEWMLQGGHQVESLLSALGYSDKFLQDPNLMYDTDEEGNRTGLNEIGQEIVNAIYQVLSGEFTDPERVSEMLALMGADRETMAGFVNKGLVSEENAAYSDKVAANKEIVEAGFEVKEIEDYVKALQDAGEMVTELSEAEEKELGVALKRNSKGFKNAEDNLEDYQKAIKTAERRSEEFTDAIIGMRDIYEDLFDIDRNKLSQEFIESEENAELLKKAIEGDLEAYDALQEAAAQDILSNSIAEGAVTINGEDAKEQLSQLATEIANYDFEDVEIGASLIDTDFWNAIEQMEIGSYEAAQAISDALSTMGVEADIVEHRSTTPPTEKQIKASGAISVPAPDGTSLQRYEGSGAVNVYTEGGEYVWYTMEGAKYKGTGVGKKGSGGRGGGGGGGGGGSRRPQAEKKQGSDKQRYHTVTNQLEDLTDAYDKVSKAADRAFGKSRVKLLREQQSALKDLAATQQDYLDEIDSYLKQDRSNLDQVSQYVGFDVQLDENGTITNFDAIQDAMWDEYNSHINDKGEVTDMDEEAWKEYEKEWERIMALIEQYEDTQDKRKEALQQLQDYINEIYDLQLEEITYAVEIDIEISDDKLEILDYLLSRIEDDAWKAAEAITYMGEQAATMLDKNDTYTSGIRDILMNHTEDIRDSEGKLLQKAQLTKADVEGFMSGDPEAINKLMGMNDAFTDEEIQSLRDYHSSLIKMNETLVELRESVFDKVLDSFEQFNEEMDKSINKIDHLSAVTDNYKNIIDIVGKKNLNVSNALLDSLNQASTEQRINRVEATRTKRDTIAAEITTAEAALADARAKGLEEDAKLWEKTLEEMRTSLDEAEEDFMQSWEDALDGIRQQFEEAVGHAVETLSDALAGPLMGSMEELQDAFDRQNTVAERYLPDYEKIYELNKLNRDITNSIDETDNIKAKQELAALQAEINALEESEAQISEYQMENLRRRYELKQAEIALTEAQDAKSQVQMSRDADGNWSYVYTANEDQVAEAEQTYEDRLFAMQEANAEYINAMNDSIIQLQAEMTQKIEEIMMDETLSAEEKMARVQEVTTFYQEQMSYYMDELELVLGENQILYEEDWAKYSELTGYKISANEDYVDNFNETALSTLTGFQTMEEYQQNFNEAIGHPDTHGLLYDLSQAYETWKNNTEAAMEAAGTSIQNFADDMAEDVDDIVDASEKATEEIEKMGGKVKQTFTDLTTAVQNWSNEYSNTIDRILEKNTALAESFNKILEAYGKYKETTTDDSTGTPEEGTEENTDTGEAADEGNDVPDPVAEKTEKYKKGIAFAIWSHPSSGWGTGNSSSNLTSGKRYDRLKAKGLDPNTVQQQINAYRGKSVDYMKQDSGISFSKWSDRVGALNPYTYKKFAFDTGGYTGDWGEEGRWALLHSKEIVLNKDDTANLLSAVDMIRQISKAIDLNAYSSAGYGNSIIKAGNGMGGTLEQNVHITAEFPNATNREEIYSAFTDIINLASQYANRK